MPILMERFRATHTGPQPAGTMKWRFTAKGYPAPAPYYEIEFLPGWRRFHGWSVGLNNAVYGARTLSDADVAKLRALLPLAVITACTAAAIEATR